MDKSKDINIINSSNYMTDKDESQVTYILTKELDKVTGSEMKKVEVQRMEDDLTIKMLEQKNSEINRTIIYSKDKLHSIQREISSQLKTIDQLEQANKAIVEKIGELKRFQTEILLVNVNLVEMSSIKRKQKIVELSNNLQKIIEKESYTESLNKDIIIKRNLLNNEVQRQIEEKKVARNSRDQALIQSKKKVELLKAQLVKKKANENLKELIDQKNVRIIELEGNEETFQRQIKQEIDRLMQEKNNNLQDLEKNTKSLEEKKNLMSKLQSELSTAEQKQTELNETLNKTISKKKEILEKLDKKRQINELSKQSFDETIKNINDQQSKINIELEAMKSQFSKTEDALHKEFNDLLAKIDDQKLLLKKLESSKAEYAKLNEVKITKQQELSNNNEQQNTFKKSNDGLKKLEQNLLVKNKKQSELDATIKELQDKISNLKQKLESARANEEIVSSIDGNKSHEVNVRSFNSFKRATPLPLSQKKPISTVDNAKRESGEMNLRTSPKKILSVMNAEKKSPYVFNSSDSEESEDEYKIINKTPESTPTQQKKPIYNTYSNDQVMKDSTIESTPTQQKKLIYSSSNSNDQVIKKSSTIQSEAEKMFEALTQTSFQLSENSKEDVFKVPKAYPTPVRKKYTQSQSKKY